MANDLNERLRLPVCVQNYDIGAAPPAAWSRLILLHFHEAGSPQHVVGVGVHSLARPHYPLGWIEVLPSVRGGMLIPTLPYLAKQTPTQLAFEMAEEVAFPLFVLLRWH